MKSYQGHKVDEVMSCPPLEEKCFYIVTFYGRKDREVDKPRFSLTNMAKKKQ